MSQLTDYSAFTGNRALSLLADNPDGCTVPIMLAHGFSIELVNQLIRARLVSARTKAPDKQEVYRDRLVHMEITDAGRRVLVDSDQPALTDARPKPGWPITSTTAPPRSVP